MGIDSKSLNAAAVSIGQGAKSNATPGTQTSQVKKSSSSNDSKSSVAPANNYAQRVTSDVNSNSAAIAATTYTGGPKFNPYLFPYMPQQMPMPSMTAPSAPKIASTGGRSRGDDVGGGEGGGGGGNKIPDGGFNGAVPPASDKDIGAFKKEEVPEKKDEAKVDPKAKDNEAEKPATKEESKVESKEENKPQTLSMLNVGFGEFS